MIATTRQMRKKLERDNLQWPIALREIPRHEWPISDHGNITRVWRSRRFLVQQHEKPGDPIRLSLNTTTLRGDGRWDDGITWDEIQQIKREIGYADRYFCELFPADTDLVNVANVRHVWMLDKPPGYAWRATAPQEDGRG